MNTTNVTTSSDEETPTNTEAAVTETGPEEVAPEKAPDNVATDSHT